MNDNLRGTIKQLKEQIEQSVLEIKADPRMVEIIKIHRALNTIEELCGQPQTSLAQLFAPEGELNKTAATVQIGAFYGMKPLKAAKRYLDMAGTMHQGISFDEILAAIKKGGCEVQDESELRISLGRATRVIAKIGDDHYGLLKFFPEEQKKRRSMAQGTDKNAPAGEEEEENNDEEPNPAVMKQQ